MSLVDVGAALARLAALQLHLARHPQTVGLSFSENINNQSLLLSLIRRGENYPQSDQMFPLNFEIRPDGGIDYSGVKIKC